MQPSFTLPPVEPGSGLNIAIKPKQIDAWLARLPYANPSEAATELTDYLATCVRTRVAGDRLDDLLERILPTADTLLDTLKEKYSAEGLPLPPNRQQAAELASRLMLEIGYICKLIILERANKRFQLFGSKPVDRHLYILMLALRQVMEISLDTHQNPPAGIWQDIHQTYDYALASGFARGIPAGFADGLSVEDLYKAMLLLILADPFRIPKEELAPTKVIVEQLCELAELVPATDARRHGSAYAIDSDSDSPVIVMSRDSKVDESKWHLLLNTTQLVKRLSLMASQYAKNSGVVQKEHPNTPADLAHLELLHRLKMHWGGSVQRLGARHPRYESTRYEVCFGLTAIHKRLEMGNNNLLNSPLPSEARSHTCQLVNDSVGGLSLAKDRPIGFRLRIGELVAVRHRQADQWGIGVVRWFRATRTGKAIFGIQLLAPRALGIRLKRHDNGEHLPALWLPATPSLRQGETLLAQAGRLSLGLEVSFTDESDCQRNVSLDKLAEFTSTIETFRFQPV
jgi:hypothetical protein